jgi:hypothetical protein
MTISTETVFTRTVGNNVTTAFSFPYHFFEEGDLAVYLEVTATGVATLQVLDTHYTVTGEDDPSGNLLVRAGQHSNGYDLPQAGLFTDGKFHLVHCRDRK